MAVCASEREREHLEHPNSILLPDPHKCSVYHLAKKFREKENRVSFSTKPPQVYLLEPLQEPEEEPFEADYVFVSMDDAVPPVSEPTNVMATFVRWVFSKYKSV
jgi:hypothetical protein